MSYLPKKLAVVGLGYVGLPLAVAFANKVKVVGFDAQEKRVQELKTGIDRNGEMSQSELTQPTLEFTASATDLADCDFIVVAVPTPINDAKQPDVSYLLKASRTVGENMPEGAIVVFESTVYPGCTEEICIPELEAASGRRCGEGFSVGYSPERINPGDPEHSLDSVVKIVSGHDAETLEKVADAYGLVVSAGIHQAPDLRTAEAAKVIENIQRDLNIALINEQAMLFHKLGLDPKAVLEAAGTKWNFLPFRPGLVGGHCIPVDPFYLSYKAQQVGFHTDVLLAGRRVNDGMGQFVAQQTIKLLIQAGKAVSGCRVLVLGLTFKPNVKDTRNSRVFDLINELQSYGATVTVHDPLAESGKGRTFEVSDNPFDAGHGYDCVVLAVAHKTFAQRASRDYGQLLSQNGKPNVVVDIPGCIEKDELEVSKVVYWRL